MDQLKKLRQRQELERDKGREKKEYRKKLMKEYNSIPRKKGRSLIEIGQKSALATPMFFLDHYNQNCPVNN